MEKFEQKLDKVKLEYKDIEVMDKMEIKKIINKFHDDEKWKDELNKKQAAKISHMRKREIKQETIYDNRYSSVYLFRARATFFESLACQI